MSAMNLAATMDAIVATLAAGGRTEPADPYPAETVSPPCWVVGYPPDIDFLVDFGRGSDRAVVPLYFVVSRNDPRTARDQLSAAIAGATEIKAILDGTLGGAVSVATVTGAKPSHLEVGGVPLLAAEFSLEIYS